jgi:hypothetical protein
MSAEVNLKDMTKALRALQKQRQRWKKKQEWDIPVHVQKSTVAIYMLNKEMQWSLKWLEAWRKRFYLQTNAAPRCIDRCTVEEWVKKSEKDKEVLAILSEINNKTRIEMDKFLIESLVYEFVLENSKKGISVPTAEVISKYIRLWTWRPRPAHIEEELKKLQDHVMFQKNWARRFRQRWNLNWGSCAVVKPLSKADLKKKAH